MAKQEIKWEIPKSHEELISKIVSRLVKEYADMGLDRMGYEMDLIACHANGNKLKLAELLAAPIGSFGHDVFGIHRFIDRTTGRLTNFFRPRYSAPGCGHLVRGKKVCDSCRLMKAVGVL